MTALHITAAILTFAAAAGLVVYVALDAVAMLVVAVPYLWEKK